jgi:hypothetical protein
LELAECRLTSEFAGHTRRVSSVAFGADGRHALSGGEDRLSVALTPDARHALAGTYDRKVLLWELRWR